MKVANKSQVYAKYDYSCWVAGVSQIIMQLIIKFAFDEATWMVTHVPLANFVVGPQQESEWHSRQPPMDPNQMRRLIEASFREEEAIVRLT